MFILDNKPIQIDTPFEHDGTSYPANWLRLATSEERAAIGITEIPDYPRPDDRFYFVSGPNEDGTYTAIPKDLAGLKTTWAAQTRQTAYTLLLPSDWMIVRKVENATDVPAEWTTYREAIRTKTADVVTALEAAADIDAFIAVVTGVEWPVSPDAPQIVEPAPAV